MKQQIFQLSSTSVNTGHCLLFSVGSDLFETYRISVSSEEVSQLKMAINSSKSSICLSPY